MKNCPNVDMIIEEVVSKGILTESKLPEADYCVNPYVGCSHKCKYCYARFMKRFTSHTEPWGDFVDIKINANELLAKKLKGKKEQKGTIILGSVTDAYQPLERKYQITRKILEKLENTEYSISILTKSNLVIRDIDLFVKMNSVKIGLTITTSNNNYAKNIEPGASSSTKRIETLKKLKEAGLNTYVFIGPIIPGITDIKEIINEVAPYVDEIWGEKLNIKSGCWEDIRSCIEQHIPEQYEYFLANVKNENYWDEVGKKLIECCEKYQIPLIGYYKHNE